MLESFHSFVKQCVVIILLICEQRQTDRRRHREIKVQKDRQTNRQTETGSDRHRDRHTD